MNAKRTKKQNDIVIRPGTDTREIEKEFRKLGYYFENKPILTDKGSQLRGMSQKVKQMARESRGPRGLGAEPQRGGIPMRQSGHNALSGPHANHPKAQIPSGTPFGGLKAQSAHSDAYPKGAMSERGARRVDAKTQWMPLQGRTDTKRMSIEQTQNVIRSATSQSKGEGADRLFALGGRPESRLPLGSERAQGEIPGGVEQTQSGHRTDSSENIDGVYTKRSLMPKENLNTEPLGG